MKNDEMKNRSDGNYGNRIRDRIAELGRTVNDAKKEVGQEARHARKEIRQQERDQIRDLRNRAEEIRANEQEYGNHYENRADDLGKRVRDVKREIREDAKQAEREIRQREKRFNDGVDSIRDDLKHQSEFRDYPASGTAPISADGNYQARDAYGSVNSYTGRVTAHANKTAERIRQEVTETGTKIRRKTEQF